MGTDNKGTKSQGQGEPRATFNPSLRVERRDELLSGELGVVAIRELDERLGLTSKLGERLYDPRDARFIRHTMGELFRGRLYSIIQGWGDQDDLDRLRNDSAFRLGVSREQGDVPLRSGEEEADGAGLASQPTQSRLTATLADEINRRVLKEELQDLALQGLAVNGSSKPENITVDIDSSMMEIFGAPAGTSYNGHYGCNGYHPQLVYLYEARAWVDAELRMGAEHSATGAQALLLPLLQRLQSKLGVCPRVRGDAAFPEEDLLRSLEDFQDEAGEASPIRYCFRLKTNAALSRMAAPYVKAPPGRRPQKPRSWTYELGYKAGDWSRQRRVVLIVKEKPDELFPDYFLLLTNYTPAQMSGEDVWAYYRQRGTMEADIGQLKTALRPHLSSTDRAPLEHKKKRTAQAQLAADQKAAFSNEATLLVFLLAYNLMRIGAGLMSQICRERDEAQSGHVRDPRRQPKQRSDEPTNGWSLQRFREQVLKCAGRFLLGRKLVRVVITQSGELWQRFWQAVLSFQAHPY